MMNEVEIGQAFANWRGMEDATEKGNTLAAPIIFIIITIVQFVPRYLEKQIKKGSMSETEVKLRQEIKQLYKEASALSQPSTFAQAAKLRRTAAAKEKEIAKYLEQNGMEKSSYAPYMKIMTPLKMFTYMAFTFWFWNYPVASISKELVQPFGNILSWKAGVLADGKVMVGIIPWLILCTRVSKLICRRIIH